MTHDAFVFVDIETSGPRVTRDRIIEIAILRVEQNQLVDTYQTLINPEGYVSPYIEAYTGITKDDLIHAPTFRDVAREIHARLAGATFVAHNVRFDYGFLKNEFARHELDFTPAQLCTVKLSRLLYPHYQRHSIDSLIERFAIPCPNRHRAYDDAMVMWTFFQQACANHPNDIFTAALAKASNRPSIPTWLSHEELQKLPSSPGVYIFYDEAGYPLYVGKSKNVRERVFSHFHSDYTSTKEMNLCQQVRRVEARPTTGELGALLKESHLIKTLQPLYNRKLRHARQIIAIRKVVQPSGHDSLVLETTEILEPNMLPNMLGIAKSMSQAKKLLTDLATEHTLCHKLLGLEKGSGPCFAYQLGKCQGACIGEELPVRYNMRFAGAFTKHKIARWPFAGPITLTEEDEQGRQEVFVIDTWCLIGSYLSGTERHSEYQTFNGTFDVDTYRILRSYLLSPQTNRNIRLRLVSEPLVYEKEAA